MDLWEGGEKMGDGTTQGFWGLGKGALGADGADGPLSKFDEVCKTKLENLPGFPVVEFRYSYLYLLEIMR